MLIESSLKNNIAGNKISRHQSGIYLSSSQNNVLSDNSVRDNGDGIYLDLSSRNTIVGNNLSSCGLGGIRLIRSSYNNISKNNSTYCSGGIRLASSSDYNTIKSNIFSHNSDGIRLDASDNNEINDNDIFSNSYGFYMHSQNNKIGNNNITLNGYGIYILGSYPGVHALHEIIGNTVSMNNYGMHIGAGSYNMIKGNIVSSNFQSGITLWQSSYNDVMNNSVLNNVDGIYIHAGYYNIIKGNVVSSNSIRGITITQSGNTDVMNNNLLNNDFGIACLSDSARTRIYHNNLIGNTMNGYDGTDMGNYWDNGYPSGGNFWSDYIGSDEYSGPNQDIPGSDGIGDTNYSIDNDSVDNYPLMSPFRPYIFLNQGWNLISLPFIQIEQNLTRVLGTIDGWYDAVQWYNITDPNDQWKHHKVGKPFGNDLFELNETMGFWIYITQPGDTIFQYKGIQPTSNQSIILYPGWNMVGYPSLINRTRGNALNNINYDSDVDAIWTFNAATQAWQEIGPADYFELGRGYWIHATQECVWEVPL